MQSRCRVPVAIGSVARVRCAIGTIARVRCAIAIGSLVASACSGCESEDSPVDAANSQPEVAAILENAAAPQPSAPLTAGAEVYDFSALGHTGQRFSLSEFLHKPVVLYFCPRDEAPQCRQLAEAFRDAWLSLNTRLSMVFAVTTEDTFVHREFASTHGLPLLFLADTELSVHRVMGVSPGSTISYLIGPDRRVLAVFPSPDAGHPQAIAQALSAHGF